MSEDDIAKREKDLVLYGMWMAWSDMDQRALASGEELWKDGEPEQGTAWGHMQDLSARQAEICLNKMTHKGPLHDLGVSV